MQIQSLVCVWEVQAHSSSMPAQEIQHASTASAEKDSEAAQHLSVHFWDLARSQIMMGKTCEDDQA